MDNGDFPPRVADGPAFAPPKQTNSAGLQLFGPLLLFAVCLAAQLYLVFFKSFNWDEFLHYNQVYELRAGTMTQPWMSIHLRLLWWAPAVSADLIDQMRAARIFIWGTHLLTLLMIYGVARHFTNRPNAFFASFAYLTSGYVFTQAFSIRGDPVVTATLMSALFLMVRGRLSVMRAIAVGALIGLAEMITFKAMFYAPCFAGLAWLQFRETSQKSRLLATFAVIPVAALLSFVALYFWHTSGFPEAPRPLAHAGASPPLLVMLLRWITVDLPFVRYVAFEVVLAAVFFLCIAVAPLAWKKAGLNADSKWALAGFIAPLTSLLFYRNTFPYYFEFVLAPVAVAIAPSLGLMRDRYGGAFLSLVLSAVPLALTVLEPREVINRQRALIDYIHHEYPKKTGYLDYSSMIVGYPRIIESLTSGNGIRLYHETGDPIVGREIDHGNVPFIIANQDVILAALQGRAFAGTFLPADLAAMTGNYVQQWGVLWREGEQIPPGTAEYRFQLRRGGEFVLAGGSVTIDGVTLAHGAKIALSKGPHLVSGRRDSTSILWRGDRLPTPPPNIPMDSVFTGF